jgi:biotin synthase
MAQKIFSKEDMVKILMAKEPEETARCYRDADQVREEFVGNDIHIRGIVEFSNYCKNDCLYCGLRRSNHRLRRYRMDLEEIYRAAREADRLRFKTIVLQSGEDPHYSTEDFCTLIGRMKRDFQMAVTLAVGERSWEDYRCFKDAGADRYLLKFETSDPVLFKKLKPESSLQDRFRCLEWLRELNFQVGSGNIVGLPGQSISSLAEDVLLFQKLDLDMIGIGPFLPHPHTPLQDGSPGDLETLLKVVALTRLITKDTNIPATTATGTLHPAGREKALLCGANVIMPNVTPKEFRKLYEIYPHKIGGEDTPQEARQAVERFVHSLGRRIATSPGHRKKDVSFLRRK